MDKRTNKLRAFKINTLSGPRNVVFEVETELTNSVICESCPYFHLCNVMPYPGRLDEVKYENTDDSNDKTFMDFCNEVTLYAQELGIEPSIGDLRPKAGTIEENLSDIIDPYKKLAQDDNRYVKLSSVIDSICEGICPVYDPSHCNCGMSSNRFCILRTLFQNNVEESEPKQEEAAEGDKENRIGSEKVEEQHTAVEEIKEVDHEQ